MEDMQLNLNQPLISVRRISSKAAPLAFDVRKKFDNSFLEIPPVSELKLDPIRSPVTIPFLWEQTPGMLRKGKFQVRSDEQPSIAPKLPPGSISVVFAGNGISSSENASSSEYTTECYSFTEGESSSSEDNSESCSYNCSITGVSELDEVAAKPLGTFSTDQWTQNFIMGRFLLAQEPPRNIQSIDKEDVRPLSAQYWPSKSPSWLKKHKLSSISLRNSSTWFCFGRNNYTRIHSFKDSPCQP